jgi:hypothetical protein
MMLHNVACFFAGLFICNGIPHLVCGLCGEPFPSPFAKPPGRGNSPALVNFFWGTFNLAVGIVLMWLGLFALGWNVQCLLFAIGFVLIGIQLSWHFGKVRMMHKNDKGG